jgi:hypothetical protein
MLRITTKFDRISSVEKDAPDFRWTQKIVRIAAIPFQSLGGLHHQYVNYVRV